MEQLDTVLFLWPKRAEIWWLDFTTTSPCKQAWPNRKAKLSEEKEKTRQSSAVLLTTFRVGIPGLFFRMWCSWEAFSGTKWFNIYIIFTLILWGRRHSHCMRKAQWFVWGHLILSGTDRTQINLGLLTSNCVLFSRTKNTSGWKGQNPSPFRTETDTKYTRRV